MIDRLCGKINKKNQEEFGVVNVDFVFVLIIYEVAACNSKRFPLVPILLS